MNSFEVPPTVTLNGAESAPRLKNQLLGVGYQNDSGRNWAPFGVTDARAVFSLRLSLYSTVAVNVAFGAIEPNRKAIRWRLVAVLIFSSLLPKSATESLIRTAVTSARVEILSVNEPAGDPDTFFRLSTAFTPTVRILTSCGSVAPMSYF